MADYNTPLPVTLWDVTKTYSVTVNPDGSINVNSIPGSSVPGQSNALVVGGITGIPASALSTIATFTAVTISYLTKVSVSGTVYAKFQLFKNTTLIDTKRSGPERSMDFLFTSPLKMAIGDILDVKVTHFVTGDLSDFEATIYGV